MIDLTAANTQIDYLTKQLAESGQREKGLLAAMKGILLLIDEGKLVRNTSEDANPSWAMRQLPFVMVLQAAQVAIDKSEGRA